MLPRTPWSRAKYPRTDEGELQAKRDMAVLSEIFPKLEFHLFYGKETIAIDSKRRNDDE